MKRMKPLFGFGLAILFIFLGIYLVNAKDSLLAEIIGIACIMFFGGLLTWAIFKKIKQSKIK